MLNNLSENSKTTAPFSLEGKSVFVTGQRGMVGSALLRRLTSESVSKVFAPGRDELDLTDQAAVQEWMQRHSPDVVIHAAGKVGGILANQSYPADFLYQNLMMGAHIVHEAYQAGVQKLLFLGSSCIYPKMAPQPIEETALLTGPLEPTNEAYAIAKITGLKLCEAYRRQFGADFISAMPTNLYGPGDNYDLESSHVIPALIRKAHQAKVSGSELMEIWGTGTPRREFLHVDDCADGCIFILKNISRALPVNLGSGVDVSIAELAEKVMKAVGFEGKLEFDTSKPDGTPRKLMDDTTLKSLGWSPSIPLEQGLADVYRSEFMKQ